MPEPQPMIGRVIGDRYRVVEEIGSGGMATVYQAEHLLLHKMVAIKILLEELAADPEMAARFEAETIAAARLDHPNCVSVTDSGRTDDGRLFLVMEHLVGQPLSDLVGNGRRIPWQRAVELARQILRGLGRAHEMGIIHRDLKPSNVMVVAHAGNRDVAKIIDFGIAKIAGGTPVGPRVETEAGIVFGTADFLAPERLGGREADPRSDLYSVGVVLYEMVTGARPFHDDDAYTIVRRALVETPKPPSEVCPDAAIPPALEAAILRALEKSPDARFPAAKDFLAALDPLGRRSGAYQIASATIPPPLAPAPPPAPAKKKDLVSRTQAFLRRTSRWKLALAATVLVGIAVLASVLGASSAAAPKHLGAATAPPAGDDVAALVKQAGGAKAAADRQRAFDRLVALGYRDRVPWADMLGHDLLDGKTCEDRHGTLVEIRRLGDPAALPYVQKAVARTDDACFGADGAATVTALGGAPAPAAATSSSAAPVSHPHHDDPGGHF